MSDSTHSARTTLATSTAALAASSVAAGQTGTVSTALPKLGPKSTASPGPGDYAGGKVDFTRTGVRGPQDFDTFGCDVFRENPNTPDWTTANAYFERKVFLNGELTMPDGRKIRHWGFEDSLKAPGKRMLPSPLMRVQSGAIVHVKLDARSSSHTIHHHGLQPSTFNDGVGHVSFEVTGDYIYQWQADHAGTFFYHCHKNTTLHFKMGMYGPLIVDPLPNANGRVPVYAGGPGYDVEKYWVLDDIDPRWQDLNHDAGLCGEDVGLNIFKPKYFLISGTPTQPNVPTNAQRIVASPGQKILIRLLNAAYSVAQVKIEGLDSHIVMTDGRALNEPWNEWLPIPAGTPFFIGTAQRRTILIDTRSATNVKKRGEFKVSFELQDWITRKVHNVGDRRYEGRAFTTITV